MPAAIPCMEQVLHCHCEGIYARGNPLHGASITLSLRGHLCPRQSPAWNKYYTVIARAFTPVAIPCMEQVQQLHRPRD